MKMKKLVVGLMVVAITSSVASAAFTFSTAELLALTKTGGSGTISVNNGVTPFPTYFTGGTMTGTVGYDASLSYLATIEYGKSGIVYGSETEFSLILINDDDDLTHAWLFIDGNKSAEVTLPYHTPVGLTMTIPGGATVFGFGLENNKTDQATDYFHVSANPVPAPGALLLAGIGTAFVGWLRRRSA
jgi:hypothetical protein